MQAILVKDGKGPIENLYFGERPIPEVRKDYVLVKACLSDSFSLSCIDELPQIKAFGLNGMDPMQRRGQYPLPPGTTDILGVEFSGYISAVGEGVNWKEGDEVFGLAIGVRHLVILRTVEFTMNQGAYAEYIIVNQAYLFSKPSYLSWVDAASIPEVFITGIHSYLLHQ